MYPQLHIYVSLMLLDHFIIMLLARNSSSFPPYITLDKLVDIHKMFLDQTEADFTEVCIYHRINFHVISICYTANAQVVSSGVGKIGNFRQDCVVFDCNTP